jgi:hypothetical protein
MSQPWTDKPPSLPYQDLGPRGPSLGVSDQNYQINPFLLGTGWDVIFDPAVWATNLTGLEIYQISLDGPIGSSVWMLRNGHQWNFVAQGWQNYYDPVQPTPLSQTDTIAFCWNVAATAGPYNRTTNIQPTVTCWLRTIAPGR